MKKILCLTTVILLSLSIASVYGQGNQAADISDGTPGIMVKDMNPSLPIGPSDAVILYDNGPVVTATGVGYNGDDVSQLQAISLGMTSFGWNINRALPYWIGDDFTVTDPGGWDVTGFSSLGYQTNSGTTSTFTGLYLIIFDGPPWGGGNIVFGDQVTNWLTSTGYTGIYRVLDNNYTANNRPLMENYAAISVHLAPGNYWAIWSYDGSSSYSGPWIPPVTILGQSTTGNGIQSDINNPGSWVSVVDVGPQGFPFKIYGDLPPVPLSGWAIAIGIGLIAAVAIIRYRKLI